MIITESSTNKADVFRFVSIREPDRIDDVENAIIDAGKEAPESSVLLNNLVEARQSDEAEQEVVRIAREYADGQISGATPYTKSLEEIDPRLGILDQILRDASATDAETAIKNAISEIGIDDDLLAEWKGRLDDSLNAAIILREGRGAEIRGIERAIRVLHLIGRVKAHDAGNAVDLNRDLLRTVVVSKSVFPLPKSKAAEKAAEEGHDGAVAQIEAYNNRVQAYKTELHENRVAIDELKGAYKKDWETLRLHQGEGNDSDNKEVPADYDGVFQKLGRWLGVLPTTKPSTIPVIDAARVRVLTEEAVAGLSEKTIDRLSNMGTDVDKIEPVYTVSRFEEKNQNMARLLYQQIGRNLAVYLGDDYVAVDPGFGEVLGDSDDGGAGIPGVCVLLMPESPQGDPALPSGIGKFQSLGIADLHVVKQALLGYEIGEIAHIENVMASESRERQHRTLDRTEEFTSITVEREETQERDLETTSRYELQKEIEESIQEASRKEAGLTVSGSYGPTVEFTANAGLASEKSSTKSNRLSTSYSKETVERSVQRIQEKIIEKRTRLAIEEVEVINKHSFTNDEAGAEHINGVYRWVDKIYQAQVFNYGKREIVEVVVPEPAAFLRFVARTSPKEGLTVIRPIEPGYCTDRQSTFAPLSVDTLTEDNYLFWVSVYNVSDVNPPPANFVTIGTAFHQDPAALGDQAGTEYVNLSNTTLNIPAGYVAKRGWFTMPMTTFRTAGQAAIGRQKVTFYNPDNLIDPVGAIEVSLDGETGSLPIAISLHTVAYFSATVEVECARTEEALNAWKIATFNAIMNKYEVLKAEYDEAVSNQELSNEVDIQGRNPEENKAIVQNELKRIAISQMTGQAFDAFDSMRDKVAPHGYPQQDIEDSWSEGQYVRFVEQAFEWENMQFLFYPYYWGKKKDWPFVSQLDDSDPLYKAFLQAGFCRINIPVRPGFEPHINTFLSTGQTPWTNEDGSVVSPEEQDDDVDPFITIAEEIKGQQGAVYIKSGGAVFQETDDDDKTVTGRVSDFEEDDRNREFTLLGELYMITAVDVGQQKLTLDRTLTAPLQDNTPYAIGAKAVGVPWRVKVPTSLVLLTDGREISDPEDDPNPQ